MTTLRRPADTAFSYTLTVRDSAGNLVTPTAAPTASMFTDSARTAGEVVLTVTPTGQPQVFTVTGPATVAGARYLKHSIPTSLGTRIDVDDDLLFESVTGGVDEVDIVTAADLAAYAGMTQDARMQTFVSAATPVVEQHVGPVVLRDVIGEVHDGGRSRLLLKQHPAVSLVSVTYADGSTPPNLAEIELDLATSRVEWHPSYAGRVFAGGRRNVRVAYKAGRSPIPQAIRLAALIIAEHSYRASILATDHDLPSFAGGGAAAQVSWSRGYWVPRRALELLAPYMRPTV